MSDKILVRDDTDCLMPTRVHGRFQDRGHQWVVTESIDASSDYVVSHVATGMAVPFSVGETPEEARKAYFEGIIAYDQQTVDELVAECDEIPDKHICPRCEGDGIVDEDRQEVSAKIRRLEEEIKRLRGALDPEFLINAANDVGGSAAAELKGLAYLQKDALDGGGDTSD
jgi:hypothetical protein